jgi:tetracycline repressor-like protein
VPVPEEFRKSVLAAAYEELTRWGIDRFSVLSMAGRHGLDLELIQQHWSSPDRLVIEVLLCGPDKESFIVPDTGSLLADLQALAIWMSGYLSSEPGRKLQLAYVIGNPNLPTANLRRAIWRARSDVLQVVVERARRRGELRDDVDAHTVFELLFAPIHMRALFTAEPIDDEYCGTISELVCRAVAPFQYRPRRA